MTVAEFYHTWEGDKGYCFVSSAYAQGHRADIGAELMHLKRENDLLLGAVNRIEKESTWQQRNLPAESGAWWVQFGRSMAVHEILTELARGESEQEVHRHDQ